MESFENELLGSDDDFGLLDPPNGLESDLPFLPPTVPFNATPQSHLDSEKANNKPIHIHAQGILPSFADFTIHSPLPISVTPQLVGNSRTKKNKFKSKENKQKKKRQRIEAGLPKEKPTTAVKSLRTKHTKSSIPENVDFEMVSLPISKPGFVGTRGDDDRIYGLQELLDKNDGFKLVEWDGSSSRPIVSEGMVIGVLVGRPAGEDWSRVHSEAFEKIMDSATRCHFPTKNTQHRRGSYATLACGISHGGGQMRPGNLVNTPLNAAVMTELVNDPQISRIAGMNDGIFRMWAPELHSYYGKTLEALLAHDSQLARNWLHSVWASVGINFGPQTVTKKHKDHANLACGMCSITPLGKFDYTRGGHLVLWTLKLIIQFPPGCTALIPSAAIPHSNTPIGEGEKRCSITQFSAGGLFRWVDYGFKPSTEYLKGRSVADQALEMEHRRKFGLTLFSKLDDLVE